MGVMTGSNTAGRDFEVESRALSGQLQDKGYLLTTTEDVINKGNADAGKMLMLRDGLRDLEKNSFADLNFNDATKYLKNIEGSAFFNHVRGTSVVTLYNDKEVWDVLGYEGASFDKGGYVNRGFNDLNWLPEPRIEEHPDHANFFAATQKKLAAKQTNANQ